MTEESGGSGLTQKAIHPNIFRLNPDRLCEIAVFFCVLLCSSEVQALAASPDWARMTGKRKANS
jgi:hypothetical protein